VFPAIQIIHACWKALAEAVPEQVSAGWGFPAYPTMAGYREGESYVMYHWGGSPGAGAIRGRDGFEQIGSLNTLGGLTLPNMELYEQVYPVHFTRLELRTDGGGAGEFRGGTGVVYEVSVTEPSKWGFRGEGLYTPSGFGLAGGRAGREGIAVMDPGTARERPAPQYAIEELPPSVFRLLSPGGGGWGDPGRREARAVERDVRNGVVSLEAARETYGVVIDPATGRADPAGTEARRRAMGGGGARA
jgi:N-methylhydantoinase B